MEEEEEEEEEEEGLAEVLVKGLMEGVGISPATFASSCRSSGHQCSIRGRMLPPPR